MVVKDHVIISIKPEYAEKILNGEKRIEYRKKIPACYNHFYLYATSPIQKIIGYVGRHGTINGTIENIWEATKDYSGITHEEYLKYFKNKGYAKGIELIFPHRFKNPISLIELGIETPPQMYRYIPWYVGNAIDKKGDGY